MELIAIKDARVPALGLGTWALTGRGCFAAVKDALDLGYRHIDTAQIYGNEEEVGTAIQQSGVKRADIFLTTKIAAGSLRAVEVRRGVEESLKRLGTGYVDLLLIHWPSKSEPLAETLAEFAAARARGKTRFIGVSNFTVALLAETVEKLRAVIVCNQVEYHPYLSQRPVIAALKKYGLNLTAYCPLARGRVTRDKELAEIGRRHGKSASQVALRWLLDQKNVAAIPKSARREHLAANLDIFDFKLAPEETAQIDAKRGAGRVVDPAGWGPEWDGP
jgi:2,5-diketo-D-gluconate reductase B